MRTDLARCLVLLPVVCSLSLASGRSARAAEKPGSAEVDAAIARGVAFLKEEQRRSGEWNYTFNLNHTLGITALAGLALLENGVKADDPSIARAEEVVRTLAERSDQTYDLSLAILFLSRVKKTGQGDDLIRRLTALEARLTLPGGRAVIVTGVHLYRTEAERLAQAEMLADLYVDANVPVVLAGDFNSRPGTAVMERLAADFAIAQKTGEHATFPADEPDREIDFILAAPRQRVTIDGHHVIAEPVASDHRPIVADLQIAHRVQPR